ncbi:MAG TPA: XdhC family protein [Anaerolineales bacterium]
MRELLPDLEQWLRAGQRVALAQVVSTWGSAPRPVGSFMAVNEAGEIAGSVSGGCVEGAVVEAALASLQRGSGELLHFGVADETAWEVGLACGGSIEVFVAPLPAEAAWAALANIKAERDVGIGTRIAGDKAALGGMFVSSNELLYSDIDDKLNPRAAARLAEAPQPMRVKLGDVEFFLNPIAPSPTLVMVGGSHIAIALAQVAQVAQFRSVIVDPRRVFASKARFPGVDQLIHAWPGEAFQQAPLNRSTALATLSHDPKIDDPALIAGLESDAFYVGALGSRKTHAKRLTRLAQAGVSAGALARIHSPIGVEIGALTPEEIAVAVMAEVIGAYRGTS